MYPFKEGETFIRNMWYVGALSSEVGRDIFARRILDEPVVFYRKESGEVAVLHGLCPHRLYPLDKGALVGDAIECGYHGYTFDCSGACTRVPAQQTVPAQFRTKSYPVVEKAQWIWIWMGEPALADEDLIPDVETVGLGVPGWTNIVGGCLHMAARWQLLIDNVMDTSHISFIHRVVLDQAAEIADFPVSVEAGEKVITVKRWMTDQTSDSPYYSLVFPENTAPLFDSANKSEFFSPALIQGGGTYFTSASLGDVKRMGSIFHIHGVTPETPTTTHYFIATAVDSPTVKPEYEQFAQEMLHERGRKEDIDALELVEPHVQDFANVQREISGRQDLGQLHVRRRIEQLFAAQRQAGVTHDRSPYPSSRFVASAAAAAE
jgi:phenylpropionate dioxygenase-like ring-hydroxylating dioxygenase large terminal subunit